MVETAIRPERPSVGTDVDTQIASDPTESLFREARRRRRRRWFALVTVLLLMAGATSFGWILSGGRGAPHGPSTTPINHQRGTQPSSARPQRQVDGAPVQYSPAQSMGSAGDSLEWAATGTTLNITADEGATWKTVTPPNLQGVTVSEDVTAVDAVGVDDLWVVISDVPGFVPYPNNGSSRGEGIDESTDGGRSWTFVSLPGCLQTCGPLAVSMVDAANGYAITDGIEGAPGLVFSTHDGGATWVKISSIPSLNGVEVSGPVEQSQLLFINEVDGWAVPGTTFNSSADSPVPGGTIYRTTDGGVSWSPVRGLPSGWQYTMPRFFGGDAAVTLGTKASGLSPTVYVTNDGGASWDSYRLPSFLGSQFAPGGIDGRFAAVGPLDWKIDVGSELYETQDGGTTWTKVRPIPAVGVGDVLGITFSSLTRGLAIGQQPNCATTSKSNEVIYCGQVLTVTNDGGRHWSPAKL